MQEWIFEEWQIVCYALHECDDEDIKYQLLLKKQRLINLCATWQVHALAVDGKEKSWGPSASDIHQAVLSFSEGMWDYDSDETDDGHDISIEEEDELVEAIEISAFADAYHISSTFESAGVLEMDAENAELITGYLMKKPSRSISPCKKTKVAAVASGSKI